MHLIGLYVDTMTLSILDTPNDLGFLRCTLLHAVITRRNKPTAQPKKDASLLVGLNKRDSLIGTQAGSANTFLSAEKERAHARERLKKKIDSASKSRNRSSTNASDASSSAGRGKGSRGTGSSA
ncbi:hypothetical protein BASA83_008583 [Batrachochytrium salamandrivorans]|nr:hypothetical protein BASA83_008583 [Batrachochytrium salamandrivorans]